MKKTLYHANLILKALGYRLVTKLTPKDNSLWLFGAWKGSTYNDNSKYLFEYVVNNCQDINAIWITRSQDVYDHIKNLGYPVELYPSHKSKWLISRAKYLFQTEGYKDTGNLPVGGSTVIQLWHGSPSKALNWFKGHGLLKELFIRIENGDRRKFYWVSQSKFYTEFYKDVFGIPESHFINTGSPRCDAINLKQSPLIDSIKKKGGFSKVVLYLPTHRNWGKDFDNDFVVNGLKTVDLCLKGTGICFLFKPHPNEVELFANSGEYTNVVILDGKSQLHQDLYQYLFHCDALVSDYSSVIYDYLICNKPIILFTYDFDRYQREDGGVPKDYIEKPIGPRVDNWESMISTLLSLLEHDVWVEKRESVQTYFNGYNSGHNSKSLVDYLRSNSIR